MKIILALALFLVLTAPYASAQDGSAVAPAAGGSADGSVATSSAGSAVTPPAPPETATSTLAIPDSRATTTPGTVTPKPFDPAQGKPALDPVPNYPTPTPTTPSEHSDIPRNVGITSGTTEGANDESDATGTILAIVASILGAGALFGAANAVLRSKKGNPSRGSGSFSVRSSSEQSDAENEADGRCFNIKKLMEEKLKELTDLRGQLESKAMEAARGAVKDAAKGTAAETALVAIERAEKEYARLKMLYEKCMIEVSAENYKGVIIEESLENKEVLKKVKIVSTKIEQVTEEYKTPWISQWTLHTVELAKSRAADIVEEVSTSLDRNHAWYADFKNDTRHYIVFRDKVFFVDRKNKEQYDEAKRYGISLGIPEYQVDFAPDVKVWER
mgnify:CR=1 FL=1